MEPWRTLWNSCWQTPGGSIASSQAERIGNSKIQRTRKESEMVNDLLGRFKEELTSVDLLIPVQEGKKMALPPHMTSKIVTIVGIKTAQSRFLPVSHEGESNETYVDKVELLGKMRAEFIARKMKGTERRSAMRIFRELTEDHGSGDGWETTFKHWFDTKEPCRIPKPYAHVAGTILCSGAWRLAKELRSLAYATLIPSPFKMPPSA